MSENMFRYVLNVSRTRFNIKRNWGELYLLDILQRLWQEISINIIGPLLKSNRMDAIVVIVDRFTKMIQLKAMTMNISLEGIAKIFLKQIDKQKGLIKK